MSEELGADLIIDKTLKGTELHEKLQELNSNLWKLQEQIKRLDIKIGKQPIKEVKEEPKSNFDKFKGSLISKIC